MEKTRSSLRKFAEVIYVMAKIGYVTAIVGVCIAGCALVLLGITGGTSFDIDTGAGITLHGLFADGFTNVAVGAGKISYALTYCIFLIAVMRMLMRLFANMRDYYTPFTMENAELFKKMAICMIIASVVPTTVGHAVGIACAKTMALPFAGEYGDSFSIFAVLVLFTMSMVFKYGCALQEQADTTL